MHLIGFSSNAVEMWSNVAVHFVCTLLLKLNDASAVEFAA